MNISATRNQNVSVSICPLEIMGFVDPKAKVSTIHSTKPMATIHPIFPAGTPLTTSSPFLRNRNPCHTEYAVTIMATTMAIYISHSITSAIPCDTIFITPYSFSPYSFSPLYSVIISSSVMAASSIWVVSLSVLERI